MNLPTPVQEPPRRQWSWIIAGVLALAVLLLYNLNRSQDPSGTGTARQSAERAKTGTKPADLRRLAENVHLQYLESDPAEPPAERLNRAIERVARTSHATSGEVRSALAQYAASIAREPGRNNYERGVAALVSGDFEAAARFWPAEPQAPTPAAPQPLDSLSAYLAAADAHLAAGRHEDAIRSCEDARRFLTRERDPESWARVQAALFNIQFSRDRLDEAFALAREVLEVRERCLPLNSPGIANALHNFGVCLARRGKPEEAAPLYQRAIAIYTEAYGPVDLAVADTASELADVLADADRPHDAEKAARNAISVYVSSGATRSPRLALALDRLGDILLSLQRPAEAEQPLAQAVAIYDALPNPRAKDHAGAEHRLGLAIARAGRRNEALPHLRRSTVLGARYFADDDPLYATYYHNLAVWADAAGDDPGTVEAYTKALGIFGRYQRRTGQTPPQKDQTASFYAEYLRRAGTSEPDVVRRVREASSR
jgi:tetratricopeptide (TPR) repeat protein